VNETAERLMGLAEAHIRDAGYRGFSFRDLAAELGIKSASVHHHFPTKATMAAAAARRYGDRFLEAVAARPSESGEEAISVYRSAFRAALDRDGRMCLYQTRKKGESVWKEISEGARFNQIVNSAFAIKSHHSSFIQVVDAVCYAYRRHLELKS
jgi:AcrR family transcriptional regulator